MKNIIVAAFAALVLGAAIASCGNNGNIATATSTPTPIPLPSTPCTPPPNTQVQVVYPHPSATGITTNPAEIIIAVAPSPLPTNYKLYVSVTDTASGNALGLAFGQALYVIPIAAVPPSALTPPFSLPIYEQSNFGGLFGTNDTFHVYLVNTNCYPGTDLLSSFST